MQHRQLYHQAWETVNRTVCFYLFRKCCHHKATIQVKNCENFMIYRLPPTNPLACSRYCTAERSL